MKTIKNINNNVSLCLDSQGREVVAFGKGIGFVKPPAEIPLSKIQRTFYNINPAYLAVIAEIPEEIIAVSSRIVDYANQKLNNPYSENVIFTLADHIQFAIKREKEHIHLKLPLLYEVQQLYPLEMKIGEKALGMIKKELQVSLPPEEAASITLHLVDYGAEEINPTDNKEKSKIEKITEFIEKEMKVHIDKRGFNYARFVTHIHYLLDRAKADKSISSENQKMFDMLKEHYPETYQCAVEIRRILEVTFNDEELLYLIIHINRLCAREDCYR